MQTNSSIFRNPFQNLLEYESEPQRHESITGLTTHGRQIENVTLARANSLQTSKDCYDPQDREWHEEAKAVHEPISATVSGETDVIGYQVIDPLRSSRKAACDGNA